MNANKEGFVCAKGRQRATISSSMASKAFSKSKNTRKLLAGCLALKKSANESDLSLVSPLKPSGRGIASPDGASTTFYRYTDVDTSSLLLFGSGVFTETFQSDNSVSLSDSRVTVESEENFATAAFKGRSISTSRCVRAKVMAGDRLPCIGEESEDKENICITPNLRGERSKRKKQQNATFDSVPVKRFKSSSSSSGAGVATSTPTMAKPLPKLVQCQVEARQCGAQDKSIDSCLVNSIGDTTVVSNMVSRINQQGEKTLTPQPRDWSVCNRSNDKTFNVTGQCNSSVPQEKDEDKTVIAECSADLAENSGCTEESCVSSAYQQHISTALKNRGQLKLSISTNESAVTVHVMEARHLTSRLGSPCNTYVQTIIVPDKHQKTGCQTAIMEKTSNPKFGEKFTYELMPEDEKKRLQINMWNRDQAKECGEFMGCMSFGLKHLKSKSKTKKEGWYYLLSENMGQRKHLPVQKQRVQHADNNSYQPISCQEQDNPVYETIDELNMDQTQVVPSNLTEIVVVKSVTGFGFTIKSKGPVCVGRVKTGGPAEQAGLQQGDAIYRINGQDVASATTEDVAKIVRESKKQISMLVSRTRSTKSARTVPLPPSPIEERIVDGCEANNLPEIVATPCKESDPMVESMSIAEKLNMWGTSLSKDMLGDLSEAGWAPELSVIREERSTDFSCQPTPRTAVTTKSKKESPLKWNPDLSCISNNRESMQRFMDSQTTLRSSLLGESPFNVQSVEYPSSSFNSTVGTEQSSTWRPVTPESSAAWQPSCSMVMDEEARRQAPLGSESETSSLDETDLSYPSTSHSSSSRQTLSVHEERQIAIQRLVACEEEFSRLMKRAVHKLSRPLRHSLLSAQHHMTLFQNIEKLTALSEFHINRIIEKSASAENSYISNTDDVIIDIIGSIYKPKAKMLCEAYKVYCDGVRNALHLLDDLQQDATFTSFLSKSKSRRHHALSIEEFLFRPIEHLVELESHIQRVWQFTLPTHPDYTDLKFVTEVFNTCLHGKSQASSDKLSRKTSSSSSSSSSLHSDYCSMTMNTRGSSGIESRSTRSRTRNTSLASSTTSSHCSVDAELADLQQKLTFARNIEPFKLATSMRHVIFSGDLLLTGQESSLPIHVIVCSDLLLLTQREAEGRLKVIAEPLMLHDIVDVNFNCDNACEFSLQYVVKSRDVRQVNLRTQTAETKWAWKTILEQRLRSFCSQNDTGVYTSSQSIVI